MTLWTSTNSDAYAPGPGANKNIAASSNEGVQADLQKLQPMQELGAVQWLQQDKSNVKDEGCKPSSNTIRG